MITNGSATGVPVTDANGASNDTGVYLSEGTYAGSDAAHPANIALAGGGSIGIHEIDGSTIRDVGAATTGTGIEASGVVLMQRFQSTAVTLNDGNATLEDGVVTQPGGGAGGYAMLATAQNLNMSVTMRQLTIVGNSGSTGFALLNEGDNNSVSVTATANVRNSIIRGASTPLDAGGTTHPSTSDTNTAAIDVDYSDFAASGDQTSGKGTITAGAHDLDVDPQFAGAGDFHLQSGSPVIDAADPASTGSSATDLDGNLRSIKGSAATTCPNSGQSQPCPDMGAYEFKPAGNNAPVCPDGNQTIPHNTSVTLTLTCTDPDTGDTLQYSVVNRPTSGTLTNQNADGHVTYNPPPGFSGGDGFTFEAVDNHGAFSNVATFGLTVAADSPPTCSDQTVAVAHDQQVTISLGCADSDQSDALHWQIVAGPHGTLGSIGPTGNVDYTPPSGFGGTDSFTFRALDTDGTPSQTQTVTLNVAPPPPVLPNGGSPTVFVDNVTQTGATFHATFGLPDACRFVLATNLGGVRTELPGLSPNNAQSFFGCDPLGASPGGPLTQLGRGFEYTDQLTHLTPGTDYELDFTLWRGATPLPAAVAHFRTPGTAPPPVRPLPNNAGVIITVTNPNQGAGGVAGVMPDTGAGSQTSADGCITIMKDPKGGHITIFNRPNDPACGGGAALKAMAPQPTSARHRKPRRVPVAATKHLRNLPAGAVSIRLKFTAKTLKLLGRYAHGGKVKLIAYTVIGLKHGQPMTTATQLTLMLRKHR
jgi:hypothetical protein